MKLRSLWTTIALALPYLTATAEPSKEGRVEAVDIPFVAPEAAHGPGILFEKEVFNRQGEEAFRLFFTGIARGAASEDIRIVIRNRVNDVIDDTPIAAFAADGDYWTHFLPGSYALVQVVGGANATAQGLVFRVGGIALPVKGANLLSQVDPLNPKDRPIAEFSGNTALMKAARSVAKLIFTKEFDVLSCTGFMVSPDVMVTNNHCISSATVCASAYATFGYERDAAGNLSAGEDFRCSRVLSSDAGLDFTAIQLVGSPGDATRWGHLQWSSQSIALNEPLVLIQHPAGDPKRAAVEGCSVSTVDAVGKQPGVNTDFGHRCDTMTGSSGSPALDTSMKIRGLHHMGYETKDRRWAFENRAVKAEQLRARISSLLGAE